MRGLWKNGDGKGRNSVAEDDLVFEMNEKKRLQLQALEDVRNKAIQSALHQHQNFVISRTDLDAIVDEASLLFHKQSEQVEQHFREETARLVEQLRKAEERERKAEERVQELYAREKSGRKLGRER